jgi:hypothetical protein
VGFRAIKRKKILRLVYACLERQNGQMSKKRNGIPPVVILRNVSDEESLWKYEVFNMKNREGRFFGSRMLAQNDRAGFRTIEREDSSTRVHSLRITEWVLK